MFSSQKYSVQVEEDVEEEVEYHKSPVQKRDPATAFAVVMVGGKQYKVVPDDVIVTEKLEGPDVGQNILLNKVLMVGTGSFTAIGRPKLESAKVYADVEEQTLAGKVIIFKKKRRKNYRRHRGHRQPITTLRITDILFNPEEESRVCPMSILRAHPESLYKPVEVSQAN